MIELFKDAVQSAIIKCRPDGISMQAMDSSHISMIFFDFKSDMFKLYECAVLGVRHHLENFIQLCDIYPHVHGFLHGFVSEKKRRHGLTFFSRIIYKY